LFSHTSAALRSQQRVRIGNKNAVIKSRAARTGAAQRGHDSDHTVAYGCTLEAESEDGGIVGDHEFKGYRAVELI